MNDNIFLLLGSNQANPVHQLAEARKKISASGIDIKFTSSLYETDPWGKTNQPNFINQALAVSTSLAPDPLLDVLLQIEIEMGRIREELWGPRIIDIDILFYNTCILHSSKLTIPHLSLPERRFALAPLYEIAPNYTHPLLNKTIAYLLENCPDSTAVRKL